MEKEMIRLLKAEEIECRVAMANEKGLSLLLYKDARVDQRILDETFGHFGWKRSHESIEGNLYCTVEVYDKESGEWVSKQDVGTMGYTEKEKTQASDSFKRACFNWGIGRELYSAPFIWVPASKADIRQKDGRYVCHNRFHVHSIGYNSNREISELEIMNENKQLVYVLKAENTPQEAGAAAAAVNRQAGPAAVEQQTESVDAGTAAEGNQKAAVSVQQQKPSKTSGGTRGRKGSASGQSEQSKTSTGNCGGNGDGIISRQQMGMLQAELERTGVAMETAMARYRIKEPDQMPKELYDRVMSALSKTKDAGAA